jgi:RNA polymerase sigma-70 factor (ECF subfamily)
MTAIPVSLLRFRLSHRGAGVGASAIPLEVDLAPERASVEDAAFEELYDAAFPQVYAFVRWQVSNTEIAQDLVSRIFVKAYRHRLRQPGPDARMHWIFRIARTTLIDYWRVEKHRDAVNLPLEEIAELPSPASDPEAAYQRKQRAAHMVRVMGSLKDDDRMMLALKFAGQRTNREIARILRISEAAVSMRLLRSLRRMRDALESKGWA